MTRFPMDANSFDEAFNYITNRRLQLLHENIEIVSCSKLEFGIKINIINHNDNKLYNAVYIYNDYRGKGIYKDYVKSNNLNILTINDCNVVDYLVKNNIPHIVVGDLLNSPAYKMIEKEYGDNVAKRSKVYLINHIDEGLYILNRINASLAAKYAYCLHPILQSDEALSKNYNISFDNIDSKTLILAMEYRKTANAYLSKREINSLDDIELSPLKDVNDMLIADKIQNRKDFELYHKGTHERSDILDQYFKNWLNCLNISEEFYQETKNYLMKEVKIL